MLQLVTKKYPRNPGRNILLVIIVLLSSLCSDAFAQEDFKKVGTTGFGFLELPVTARQLGMADALVASESPSANAVFTNPAGLANISNRHSFSASYGPWLVDMTHSAFSYGLNMGMYGHMGIHGIWLDMGTMQRTVFDPTAVGGFRDAGQFSAGAGALGITYARRMTDQFAFGGNIKYVQETIDNYEATNVLIDIGTLYNTGFGSFRIGTNIQNFGLESQFIGDVFKMPITFLVGGAMEVIGSQTSANRLTVSLSAVHPSNYTERVHLGGEYVWQNLVSLRGGYKWNYDEQSWAVGAGVHTSVGGNKIILNGGYSTLGRLGSVMRWTIEISI